MPNGPFNIDTFLAWANFHYNYDYAAYKSIHLANEIKDVRTQLDRIEEKLNILLDERSHEKQSL